MLSHNGTRVLHPIMIKNFRKDVRDRIRLSQISLQACHFDPSLFFFARRTRQVFQLYFTARNDIVLLIIGLYRPRAKRLVPSHCLFACRNCTVSNVVVQMSRGGICSFDRWENGRYSTGATVPGIKVPGIPMYPEYLIPLYNPTLAFATMCSIIVRQLKQPCLKSDECFVNLIFFSVNSTTGIRHTCRQCVRKTNPPNLVDSFS